MTLLVTEFTAHNAFEFEEAYERACRYVEELRSVSVVDSRDIQGHDDDLAISIYAARHKDLHGPACTTALRLLAERQTTNIALTLAIASMGNASEQEILDYLQALGDTPIGASRWMESISDPDALYTSIVKWLLHTLSRRTRSGATIRSVVEEGAASIDKAEVSDRLESQPRTEPFFGVP